MSFAKDERDISVPRKIEFCTKFNILPNWGKKAFIPPSPLLPLGLYTYDIHALFSLLTFSTTMKLFLFLRQNMVRRHVFNQ